MRTSWRHLLPSYGCHDGTQRRASGWPICEPNTTHERAHARHTKTHAPRTCARLQTPRLTSPLLKHTQHNAPSEHTPYTKWGRELTGKTRRRHGVDPLQATAREQTNHTHGAEIPTLVLSLFSSGVGGCVDGLVIGVDMYECICEANAPNRDKVPARPRDYQTQCVHQQNTKHTVRDGTLVAVAEPLYSTMSCFLSGLFTDSAISGRITTQYSPRSHTWL